MLFPQDGERLCPPEWIEAAWDFIQEFRSNFSLYPEEGLFYQYVTIIGDPEIQPNIDMEIEEALREGGSYVERISVADAGHLHEILQERIDKGVRFPIEDERPDEPRFLGKS